MYDIIISGQHCSIECSCHRWTIDNFSATLETWLTKSNVQALRNSITPNATKELYSILGLPHFCDQTWTKHNTLRIIPNPSSTSNFGSNLGFMRKEKIGYVKNINTEPIEGNSGWINCKLEFFVSGASEL